MHTINLTFPVEVNGETHSNLTIRRSKVKDRLAVAKMKNASDEEKEIRFFANLCEVAPGVIEELDEADYKQLSETYMGFFKQEETLKEPLSSSQKSHTGA